MENMILLIAEQNPSSESVEFYGNIYFYIALVSTIMFAFKFLMMFIGGDTDAPDAEFSVDLDGDIDFDADADPDAFDIQHGSTAAFNLFSIQAILAFLMGFGWVGYISLVKNGYWGPISFLIAFAVGLFLMFLQAFLLMQIRKLDHAPKYDLKAAVGSNAQVYMKIPGQKTGVGKVEVNVSGRRKVIDAVTDGDEIESFKTVRILQVLEGAKLLVELA